MTEEKIVIKISENGEIIADVHGIKGPVCIDKIQKLLEEVAEIYEIHKKDEYYMRPSVVQKTVSKDKVVTKK